MKKNLILTISILANLVPLYGVLFWQWNPITVLFVYWQEALIVGIYNIPKLFLATLLKKDLTHDEQQKVLNELSKNKLSEEQKETVKALIEERPNINLIKGKTVLVLFFCLHYFSFLFAFFGIIGVINRNFGSISGLSLINITSIVFFVSHGLSFIFNYYLGKEYKTISVSQQMILPYKRVAILHIGILLGITMMLIFNFGNSFVAGLVLAKIIIDVFLHINSHKIEDFNNKTL